MAKEFVSFALDAFDGHTLIVHLLSIGWGWGRRPEPSHPAAGGRPRKVWGATQHCHHQAGWGLPGGRRVWAVSTRPIRPIPWPTPWSCPPPSGAHCWHRCRCWALICRPAGWAGGTGGTLTPLLIPALPPLSVPSWWAVGGGWHYSQAGEVVGGRVGKVGQLHYAQTYG